MEEKIKEYYKIVKKKSDADKFNVYFVKTEKSELILFEEKFSQYTGDCYVFDLKSNEIIKNVYLMTDKKFLGIRVLDDKKLYGKLKNKVKIKELKFLKQI